MEQKMKNVDINTLDTHDQPVHNNYTKKKDTPGLIQVVKPTKEPQVYEEPKPDGQSSLSTNTTDCRAGSKSTFVPYSELKGISDITLLPSGVDPLHRETSLSNEEFYQVFGMDKVAFSKLPTWKRVNKKKDKLLF